ncbi:sugar transferase [Pseudalkalibacillus hwajinpoensis]|nr:sugar transferase [Pseudalkalibacillus hwajinpoensis]WLR61831.1 sugar transferase [Pseudalkalibacillus hwajinpoensis]
MFSIVILGAFILLRFKIGSPVLFKQERIGYKEKTFTIYKFRTMSNECDGEGKLLPASERLIPFGRFLRRLSIDEIPQLFNVLKGDMSLVGRRDRFFQDIYLTIQRRNVNGIKLDLE